MVVWIKRREVLDLLRVEWDGESIVDHRWERVKWAIREFCDSLKEWGKNPKRLWWSDEVKERRHISKRW